MGSVMYAYLEIFRDKSWVLADELEVSCEFDNTLVPKNIAPSSWGKFNFTVYYETSGEKGFPDDISLALQDFVQVHWQWANRPSWMTIKEIRDFYDNDAEGRFSHLDFEALASKYNAPETHLRVVFWADQ